MDTLIIFGGFLVGLILLVKGADEMVKSAIQIAVKFKLPNSIIGATFIGFGTSAPELFASTGAAINGDLSFCLLYTSPSPRDGLLSRMPSSA